MRDPTVNATAAAEAKRVRDAIDEARYSLFSMIRWLHYDEKNPAAAGYKYAVKLVVRALNTADGDKLIRKFEPAPDARDKIVSFLLQGRPPRWSGRGRRANTLRDQFIADIVDRIRLRGFDIHRGDATRDKDDPHKSSIRQSACSIVATAWRELEDGKPQSRLERGFAPLRAGATKALSESSIERIWDESTRAAEARARSRLTSRR